MTVVAKQFRGVKIIAGGATSRPNQAEIRFIRTIRVKRLGATLLLLLVSLSSGLLHAQQPIATGQSASPQPPIAPLDERDASTVTGHALTGAQDSTAIQPDTHTLSGAETFGLGSLRSLSNAFSLSLFLWESADTGSSANRVDSLTSVGGTLGFSRSSRRTQSSLAYTGGVSTYSRISGYNQFHQLAISQSTSLGRWILRWGNQVMFSSQNSYFGGLASTGFAFGGPTGPVAGLQPSAVPNLNILTGNGRSVADSAWGEADYDLSRRTTLTAWGSYGLLRFATSGYVSGQQLDGRVGYNYALSPQNSLSLFYSYDQTSFSGANQRVQDQSLQFGYGRKITGRLALQASGGPVLLHLSNYGGLGAKQASWNAYTSLAYRLRRITYTLSYSYGVTMGSGVLYGANTSLVTLAATYTFRRYWTASASAAYARNSALQSSAGFSGRFDDWYANVTVARQLGRRFQLGLNYGYQQQRSAAGNCPVVSCGTIPAWQVFGANVTWRPFAPKL